MLRVFFLLFFFQCNVPCGDGTQRRDIICVKKLGSDFTVASETECAHLEKPAAVQECKMDECQPQWFTTEWSAVRDGKKVMKEKTTARCFPLYLNCGFFVVVLSVPGLVGRAYR